MTSLPARMYWNARGYFAFPIESIDLGLGDAEEWAMVSNMVEHAKNGHFNELPEVVQLYDYGSWTTRSAYTDLLGDAADDATLDDLFARTDGLPVEYQYDFANCMSLRGHLSCVPPLVELYKAHHASQDAVHIPPRISRLVEEQPGPIAHCPVDASPAEVASYCQLVLGRHSELRLRLGTEDVPVLRGRVLKVEWLAECMLEDLRNERFDPEMRHKFEAMTGVDCSEFYRNEVLQPLTAAAIVLDWLSTGAASSFADGVRYFFGRCVPQRL